MSQDYTHNKTSSKTIKLKIMKVGTSSNKKLSMI